jgi:hypothetical protein
MITTIEEFACQTGLSESTIRRDIRSGHLKVSWDRRSSPTRFYSVNENDLEAWLVARRQRCNGLTLESNKLLAEPREAEGFVPNGLRDRMSNSRIPRRGAEAR